jgi:hypothetical protein
MSKQLNEPMGHRGIPIDTELQGAEWHLEIGREPGFIPLAAGKEVLLSHVPLVQADIHIVKLCGITCLQLDLLGHIPASLDPVALELSEDGPEAAFFDPVAALQDFKHVDVSMRILEVQIERGWIADADPGRPCSLPQSSTQPLR